MGNPTVWIDVANVLYLASYSVRDILWLRLLTVVASLLLIPYYAMQPVPLAPAIAWNVVFIAINTYWIIKLLIERRHGGEIGEVIGSICAGGSEGRAIQEAQGVGSRARDPGATVTAGPVLGCDIVLSEGGADG